MEWKSSKKIKEWNNNYEIPTNWLGIEYYEALNILFRVENTLRILVFIILKTQHNIEWKNLMIKTQMGKDKSVNSIANQRLKQDNDYGYLWFSISTPLLHLTSNELINLIFQEEYRKYFKGFFPWKKEIIKYKLDEIGNIRNALAHFRPIKKWDIDLIKQNSLHTLWKIENFIYNFISFWDNIAHSNNEDWYKKLKSLKEENFKISFNEDEKKDWVSITLTFSIKTFEKEKDVFSDDLLMKAFIPDNNKIMERFENLVTYSTCITENYPFSYLNDINQERELEKQLKLKFSKENLEKNYEKIYKDLESLSKELGKDESTLESKWIRKWNILEVVECTYGHREYDEGSFYSLDITPFKTKITDKSPQEFWGNLNYTSRDFVTSSSRYPWMPVNISN